jgi:hypothetical protein
LFALAFCSSPNEINEFAQIIKSWRNSHPELFCPTNFRSDTQFHKLKRRFETFVSSWIAFPILWSELSRIAAILTLLSLGDERNNSRLLIPWSQLNEEARIGGNGIEIRRAVFVFWVS